MSATDHPGTELPSLSLLVEAVGRADAQLALAQLENLDQYFGFLFGSHVEGLKFLADGEPGNEISEHISELFESIQAALSELSTKIEQEAIPCLDEETAEIEMQWQGLLRLQSDFQQALTQGPRYSKIPYTHELIRVCRHYLKGNLGFDAVLERLADFCQYHENLETQLSSLVPSSREKEAFNDNLEDLNEALNLQWQGAEELELALEENNTNNILQAIELIQEAGEALVEIHQVLEAADTEPQKVLCLRCGADNSPDSKVCHQCQATLVFNSGSQVKISTITLEEDGRQVQDQTPEKLRVLQTAIHQALHTGDKQALLASLNQLEQKLIQSRQQLSRFGKTNIELAAEEGENLTQTQTQFHEALDLFEQGLLTLDQGTNELDPLPFETGFQKLEEVFHLLQELSSTLEELGVDTNT